MIANRCVFFTTGRSIIITLSKITLRDIRRFRYVIGTIIAKHWCCQFKNGKVPVPGFFSKQVGNSYLQIRKKPYKFYKNKSNDGIVRQLKQNHYLDVTNKSDIRDNVTRFRLTKFLRTKYEGPANPADASKVFAKTGTKVFAKTGTQLFPPDFA